MQALLALGLAPEVLAEGLARQAPETQPALAKTLSTLMRLPDPQTDPAHCGILRNAAVIFEAGTTTA